MFMTRGLSCFPDALISFVCMSLLVTGTTYCLSNATPDESDVSVSMIYNLLNYHSP